MRKDGGGLEISKCKQVKIDDKGKNIPREAGLVDACLKQTWRLLANVGYAPTCALSSTKGDDKSEK